MSDTTYLDENIELLRHFHLPPKDTPFGTLLISKGNEVMFIYVNYKYKWALRPTDWCVKVRNVWRYYSYDNVSGQLPVPDALVMVHIALKYINTMWLRLITPGLTLIHGIDQKPENISEYYKTTAKIPMWEK